MPLYLFYTTVQKSQKWPKTQIKGGGGESPALICIKSLHLHWCEVVWGNVFLAVLRLWFFFPTISLHLIWGLDRWLRERVCYFHGLHPLSPLLFVYFLISVGQNVPWSFSLLLLWPGSRLFRAAIDVFMTIQRSLTLRRCTLLETRTPW